MRALLFLRHAAVTTMKMTGGRGTIVRALWRLFMVQLWRDCCLMVQNDTSWCLTKQSYQKLCAKAIYALVPLQ